MDTDSKTPSPKIHLLCLHADGLVKYSGLLPLALLKLSGTIKLPVCVSTACSGSSPAAVTNVRTGSPLLLSQRQRWNTELHFIINANMGRGCGGMGQMNIKTGELGGKQQQGKAGWSSAAQPRSRSMEFQVKKYAKVLP